MNITHLGERLIFYFSSFIELFLYTSHCLFHKLESLLLYVSIYAICIVCMLFTYVQHVSSYFGLFLLFRFIYVCTYSCIHMYLLFVYVLI